MRIIVLWVVGLGTLTNLSAADSPASPTPDPIAVYQKTIGLQLSPGIILVASKTAPFSAIGLTGDVVGDTPFFILTLGSLRNIAVVKYRFASNGLTDGRHDLDAIFIKALNWKDVATSDKIDTLLKSLATYGDIEFNFKISTDESKDGIYLDSNADTPAFSMDAIRQLHELFGFLDFMDSYKSGTNQLEVSLLKSRQDNWITVQVMVRCTHGQVSVHTYGRV